MGVFLSWYVPEEIRLAEAKTDIVGELVATGLLRWTGRARAIASGCPQLSKGSLCADPPSLRADAVAAVCWLRPFSNFLFLFPGRKSRNTDRARRGANSHRCSQRWIFAQG